MQRRRRLSDRKSRFDFSEIERIFSGNDQERKITAALNLLNINLTKFSRIHTLKLKEEQLRYKYLKKELELIRSKVILSESNFKKFIELTEKAYDICQSSLLSSHHSKYSPYSVGLHEIDVRTVHAAETSELDEFSINQSVLSIGTKDSGVEPGFQAIQMKDVLLLLDQRFPDKNLRWQALEAFNCDVKKLYEKFKNDLPKYIVKLSYDELSGNKLMPNKEDLKRSKTIQGIYDKSELIGDIVTFVYREVKSCSPTEKNIEAVLEVIGNDIARVFGMTVQEQFIYQGSHSNKSLKLMLKAKWVEGASTLKPLAGGTNNDNYCVHLIILSSLGITAVSDDSIKKLPQYLPLFEVQGDRDAFGSRGENKLRDKDKLIGIDFGHVYQETVLDKVSPDFHVQDPRFKNYSIFYDAQRSQFVRGLFRLARLSGEPLDESVLRSYGEDFYSEIMKIEPHADETIFDDYITKFGEIAGDFDQLTFIDQENRNCCREIIKKVSEVKKEAIRARNDYINKFRSYLKIERKAADLIENFEKILAGQENTSLRSPDETVLLNHVRVKNRTVLDWNINLGYQQRHQFIASFKDLETAKKAHHFLLQWLHEKSPDSGQVVSFIQKGNTIEIDFDKIHLDKIYDDFNEDKIKRNYHKNDYTLYQCYLNELQLVEFLKTFSSYGIAATLNKHPSTANTYQLVLDVEKGKYLDLKFLEVVKSAFPSYIVDGKTFIDFPLSDISSVYKLLASLPFQYNREKVIEEDLSKFYHVKQRLCSLLNLDLESNFALKREKNEFIFSFKHFSDSLFAQQLEEKLSGFEKNLEGYVVNYTNLGLLISQLQQVEDAYQKALVNIQLQNFDNISGEFSTHSYTQDIKLDLILVGTYYKFTLQQNPPNEFRTIFHEVVAGQLEQQACEFEQQAGIYIVPVEQIILLNQKLSRAKQLWVSKCEDKDKQINSLTEILQTTLKTLSSTLNRAPSTSTDTNKEPSIKDKTISYCQYARSLFHYYNPLNPSPAMLIKQEIDTFLQLTHLPFPENIDDLVTKLTLRKEHIAQGKTPELTLLNTAIDTGNELAKLLKNESTLRQQLH